MLHILESAPVPESAEPREEIDGAVRLEHDGDSALDREPPTTVRKRRQFAWGEKESLARLERTEAVLEAAYETKAYLNERNQTIRRWRSVVTLHIDQRRPLVENEVEDAEGRRPETTSLKTVKQFFEITFEASVNHTEREASESGNFAELPFFSMSDARTEECLTKHMQNMKQGLADHKNAQDVARGRTRVTLARKNFRNRVSAADLRELRRQRQWMRNEDDAEDVESGSEDDHAEGGAGWAAAAAAAAAAAVQADRTVQLNTRVTFYPHLKFEIPSYLMSIYLVRTNGRFVSYTYHYENRSCKLHVNFM